MSSGLTQTKYIKVKLKSYPLGIVVSLCVDYHNGMRLISWYVLYQLLSIYFQIVPTWNFQHIQYTVQSPIYSLGLTNRIIPSVPLWDFSFVFPVILNFCLSEVICRQSLWKHLTFFSLLFINLLYLMPRPLAAFGCFEAAYTDKHKHSVQFTIQALSKNSNKIIKQYNNCRCLR